MNEQLVSLAKTLQNRGFKAHICENHEQAVELIQKMLIDYGPISSIGFGNSATLTSMELKNRLSKHTPNIYIHAPIGTEDIDRKALTADFYFTSANAVSLDGHIVNIDGTGNRTSATCFGPGNVVYIVGKNKVTETLEDAIFRAKSVAIQLARKYNRKTPCVLSGKCEDCISPESICAVTTIHRKKPYGINVTVIFIDEELGI